MESKKNVLVICGGRSPEHRISLISASSVITHLDREKYNIGVIVIEKDGQWYFHGSQLSVEHPDDPNLISALNTGKQNVLIDHNYEAHAIIDRSTGEKLYDVHIAFPVLHGENGEDGSIQGLLRIAGIPHVGCDVLGSAVCMDKDVAKRLLRDQDIPVADFVTLRYNSDNPSYTEIVERLGTELFIKPANLGSSVGVEFVEDEDSFNRAVKNGFTYDSKVLVEEKIIGREIECAVLGNLSPAASPIGEIIPKSGIYSFDNKYVDDDGAALGIPADIPEDIAHKAKAMAVEIFTTLECKGMARVDMFLKPDGSLLLNEVNTIPGFTSISMYPKLWIEAGMSYARLLDNLLELAED